MALETNIEHLITDFTCGFCLAQLGYEIIFADRSECLPPGFFLPTAGQALAVIQCHSCKTHSVLFFAVEDQEEPFPMEETRAYYYLEEHPEIIDDEGKLLSSYEADGVSYVVIPPLRLKLMGQYPYARKFDDGIPESLRQDVQEAGSCLAIGAANASAVMSRRVVERLAKSLGLEVKPRDSLCSILKKLKDGSHIDETLFNAMMEVKDWGNIGAHPGEEDSLKFDDARQVLSLVIQAIEYACSNQRARLETSTRTLSDSRNP
ncbi:MAG: DUF4145 domain-containing protein [Anaerolineaceae bacterium]|nr:DUF4145 domain-containing protein [Anaerolineaceae bacterium]